MTANQAIETRILIPATTRIALARVVVAVPSTSAPSQPVSAKCPGPGMLPCADDSAYSSARSARMHSATARTVAST